MKVFVDADGCPVVDETVKTCLEKGVECIIICDTSHVFERGGAVTVTVSKGADSVDFKLVNMIGKGDVAVTQDYGLAAMCLARGAHAINQDGKKYTDENISGLLESRAFAKKIRRAGGRLKGPKKRTQEQDETFVAALRKLIDQFA